MRSVFFTIADENNMAYAKMLEKSLKHFNPDIPLIIYGEKEIAETGMKKPDIFYIATPYFARKLIKEYDQVIKIDADSIVTAPLEIVNNVEHFDLAVTYNWTRDAYSDQVTVWDILPKQYVNNGFVVFRSKEVIEHIWFLCGRPNLQNYQMREQDMLNIVTYYGHYDVKFMDNGDSWYGLRSKSEWLKCIMKNGLITLLPTADGFPEREKTVRIIHFAGGNEGIKMNYKIKFNEEVSNYIDGILHE